MPAFALTVFLGAFLLFQVQPLLGRHILPWFGGGPSVWTSCMLFFQALLLGGYAYAHGLASRIGREGQARLHVALLAASLFALPIGPDNETWRRVGEADPTLDILLLLAATAGPPYLVLSATSPLLQGWFHRLYPNRSAYRLYALSNAGSLIALLSYPAIIEPLLTVRTQALVWSASYAAFVVCCAWCAWLSRRAPLAESSMDKEPAESPSAGAIAKWTGLSACGSTLLLAATNQMSQEVAVVPFLWVLPLTLYLLTFVLCFESDRWYSRRGYGFLLAAAAPAACAAVASGGVIPLPWQIAIYSAAMFAGCMVFHGELAASRPSGRDATKFYLILGAGGALGGFFVAVVAPRLFSGFWEYLWALAAACFVSLYAWIAERRRREAGPTVRWSWEPPPALIIALFTIGYTFAVAVSAPAVAASRNFHGVLRVVEETGPAGPRRVLKHGRTEHGAQFLDPAKRSQATTYFGPGTGAALVFRHLAPRSIGSSLKVAVVGLGTGTLATYGRKGDYFRFYEIDPSVRDYASEYFTYLSDSSARVDVVIGDARVLMEAELADGEATVFDILVVDAFTSGAIPIHLLTAEAGEVYARRIREDGVLLFHVTNRFLDLEPVLRGMAERLGMSAAVVRSPRNEALGVNQAVWMILTRDSELLGELGLSDQAERCRETLLWTDDFAGLRQVLR